MAVTVSGMNGTSMDALVGGAGADTFTLGARITTFNGSIAGGGGIDTLAATDGTNAWDISGANAGTLNTTTTFSGITNLTGGTGADTFTFSAAGSSISGLIDGGAGADAADFSTSTAVTNVTLGSGVVNVETLTGSATQTLVGANITNTWAISGANAGSVTDGDGAEGRADVRLRDARRRYGLRFPDDSNNLERQFEVYDALYAWCNLQLGKEL